MSSAAPPMYQRAVLGEVGVGPSPKNSGWPPSQRLWCHVPLPLPLSPNTGWHEGGGAPYFLATFAHSRIC